MGKKGGGSGSGRGGGGGNARAKRSQQSRQHGRNPNAKVAAFSGSKEAMFGGGKRGIMSIGEKVSAGEAFALSGKKARKRRGDGGTALASMPIQGYDPGSRKQRRRDERMERKRAKLEMKSATASKHRRRHLTDAQLTAVEAGGNKMAHDSQWGNDIRRQKMLMSKAVSAVETERTRLTSYIAPEVEAEIAAREEIQAKRIKTLHPVTQKLEVEHNPDLGYVDPGSGAVIVRLPRPATENLFETTPEGGFWARAETRPFCQMLLSAAAACKAVQKAEQATGFLKELERLDATDSQDVRTSLVLAHLDMADALAARAILERHTVDRRAALEYSRALIEYISWAVLEEEGASEVLATAALKRATESNGCIAVFIAHADAFSKFVDPNEVDEFLPADGPKHNPHTVEEAFRYCVDGLSPWRDAEGAEEWVRAALPAPLPTPMGGRKWVAIYNDALEYAMESAMIDAFGGGTGEEGEGGDGAGPALFDDDGRLVGIASTKKKRDDDDDGDDDDDDEDDDEEEAEEDSDNGEPGEDASDGDGQESGASEDEGSGDDADGAGSDEILDDVSDNDQ